LHFCWNIAANILHGKWEGKNTLHEESNGKAAAAVASKHSIDDSDSSVEEMQSLEHVSGGKCDCHSATKAKHRSQI